MLPRRVLAVCLAVLLSGSSAFAQDASLEYAIKATYLPKFVPFVDWPAATFAAAEAPVTICIAGRDPFGDILDRALAGIAVGPHPVALKRLATARRDAGCNVLFVGESPEQSPADALAAVRGAPILTVTDAAEGDDAGIVNFVVVGSRVRFEIDERAAAENGLSVSAKLLNLATAVRRR